MTAWSPTNRSLPCPVKENSGVHTATFQPDETGEWSIAITHKGTHIQGGPFTCFVFDPNGIKVIIITIAVIITNYLFYQLGLAFRYQLYYDMDFRALTFVFDAQK